MTYATHLVYEEAAYLAYHAHWSLDAILDLEHADRRRFIDEIAHLHTRPQR